MLKKAMFLMLSVLMLFTPNVSAQYELESVIYDYETTKTSESERSEVVEQIDSESIADTGASTIDDILKLSSAATTTRGPRASAQTIQIRGLDSKKIFISMDGVRQNFRSGHNTTSSIDLENLKAVKIFKDSSHLAEGTSLGGGVRFVTKDPSDYLRGSHKLGSEFKFQHNSASSENIYGAKTIFRKKGLSGYISLANNEAGNIQLSDGTELQNSSFQRFSSFTKINYKKLKLSHEYSLQNDNNPTDSSLDPPSDFQRLHSDNKRIKNTLNLEFLDENTKANIYYTDYSELKTRRDNRLTQTRSISTLGFNIKKGLGQFEFGLEGYADRLIGDFDGALVSSYPNAEGMNLNTSMQYNKKWGRFTLAPGLKLSTYSLSAQDASFQDKQSFFVSKNFHMGHATTKNLKLMLSYSEGFNAPRVNEVFPSGLHARGDDFIIRDNFFIPNPDLIHETSQLIEVGFKQNILNRDEELLTLEGSVYQNSVKNFIGFDRIDRSTADPINGTTQYVNRSRVRVSGGELKLKYLYDRFDMSASYTFGKGKDFARNLYLEDLAADQFQYNFKYYLDEHGLTLGYLGTQAQGQSRTNSQTFQRADKTPAYFIHSIFATKSFKRDWFINARIDNLTNQNYRRHAAYLAAPGQDIRLSFKYKVNTI